MQEFFLKQNSYKASTDVRNSKVNLSKENIDQEEKKSNVFNESKKNTDKYKGPYNQPFAFLSTVGGAKTKFRNFIHGTDVPNSGKTSFTNIQYQKTIYGDYDLEKRNPPITLLNGYTSGNASKPKLKGNAKTPLSQSRHRGFSREKKQTEERHNTSSIPLT